MNECEKELGYIKAAVGAVGDESAYDAVRRFMQQQRVYDNFLPNEIQKILVEFGFATPEKTYRDNPHLLLSDLREILGSLTRTIKTYQEQSGMRRIRCWNAI